MANPREDGQDYREAVRRMVLNESVFVGATFSVPRNRRTCPWTKVAAKPVRVKGRPMVQFAFSTATREVHRNVGGQAARECLDEVFALPFGQINVEGVTGNLHVKITRKGKVMMSCGKAAPVRRRLSHDRAKGHLLHGTGAEAFLKTVGIMNQRGEIAAAMQAKFRQINAFLDVLVQTVGDDGGDGTLHILDCGCGRAYLTFAAYHYISDAVGRDTTVTGVDSNPTLIEECKGMAESLGWTGMEFRVASIADFHPPTAPDVVLSLHACDTATDEAIAKAVLCDSRVLLAAPCCQHELHQQLDSDAFRAATRHGILRERMADIVTDALRAAALRVAGYRTTVVEFVSPEHSSKNLMIRAVRASKPGREDAVKEYLALRDFWGVRPRIEELLGASIGQYLA